MSFLLGVRGASEQGMAGCDDQHAEHQMVAGQTRELSTDGCLERSELTGTRDTARQMLVNGKAENACRLLENAVKINPTNLNLWLDLAATLRQLKRRDEEMSALQKALAIDPRNSYALLQKASLQEMQQKPRDAAITYGQALQTIPRGRDLPLRLRPSIRRAVEVCEANNRSLEAFLDERLKNVRARFPDEPLRRFDRCLALLLRRERMYLPQPTFMYFPNLPPIEFFDRSEFPWLDPIEAATDAIREELVDVLADGPDVLQPYVTLPNGAPSDRWRALNHSRRWGVYFFWREGVVFPEHIARCPRTAAALQSWPQWDVPGCGPTAMFSILDARTRIPPHNGTMNTRLVVHLPLIVPPGCGFRVGGEQRQWHEGKAFVFDDTFEHEAWNDSDVPRAVLILDTWNPGLSAAERELVRELSVGVGEYYGTMPFDLS